MLTKVEKGFLVIQYFVKARLAIDFYSEQVDEEIFPHTLRPLRERNQACTLGKILATCTTCSVDAQRYNI